MIPPDPPKGKPQVFDRRGARAKAQSRPPARFTSQANTRKYTIMTEPKHGSETACLLRPLRRLLSMSQRGMVYEVLISSQFGKDQSLALATR